MEHLAYPAPDTGLSAKLELLKGVNLFSTLEKRELEVVAQNSDFRSYRKGDAIFHEGSRSGGLYVISRGEVLISKKRADGDTMDIAQFIQGESFGEMDLLENREMTASARAEAETVLLIFPSPGTRLQDVLGRHPDISARILHELMAVIAGRIRGINRLISEKSQWVRDLKRQLYYDKLTGLYNRTFLDEEFPKLCADYGPETSVIMIKPDNFKAINDLCGHDAGDRALRLIAFSVKSQVRHTDIVARYRGDEFAVIFPGTGIDKALVFAEHVRSLLSKLDYTHITGTGFTTTVSIGLGTFPRHAGDPKELISLCFKRMFSARDEGGDRVSGI
jgi:diguanylate cyclase (GGDEF)-like protein